MLLRVGLLRPAPVAGVPAAAGSTATADALRARPSAMRDWRRPRDSSWNLGEVLLVAAAAAAAYLQG